MRESRWFVQGHELEKKPSRVFPTLGLDLYSLKWSCSSSCLWNMVTVILGRQCWWGLWGPGGPRPWDKEQAVVWEEKRSRRQWSLCSQDAGNASHGEAPINVWCLNEWMNNWVTGSQLSRFLVKRASPDTTLIPVLSLIWKSKNQFSYLKKKNLPMGLLLRGNTRRSLGRGERKEIFEVEKMRQGLAWACD